MTFAAASTAAFSELGSAARDAGPVFAAWGASWHERMHDGEVDDDGEGA
jgi:hypothetical protein